MERRPDAAGFPLGHARRRILGSRRGRAQRRPYLCTTFACDIRRAYQWTRDRYEVLPLRNGTWVRGYPSRVFAFAPLEYYFPDNSQQYWGYEVELGAHHLVTQGILDPHAELVTEMIEQMEDGPFLDSGLNDYPARRREANWFDLGGFSRVQPWYCRIAEIHARRHDVKPFLRCYFNTLATLLNRQTLTFWEHFNNFGAWNKTHETGYFLQQTRFMLALDEDTSLHLAPLCPKSWYEHGRVISAEGLPTRFGKVGFRIESHLQDGYIKAQIDPPASLPAEMTIRFRHPHNAHPSTVLVYGCGGKTALQYDGTPRGDGTLQSEPRGSEAASVCGEGYVNGRSSTTAYVSRLCRSEPQAQAPRKASEGRAQGGAL